MARVSSLIGLTVAAILFVTASSNAQVLGGVRNGTNTLTTPIVGTGPNGQTFNGSFTLQRFVATATGVNAVGLVTGVLTNNGVSTAVVQNVVFPVTATQLPSTTAACPILHLDLGPLFLDVLGLQIDLSRVILDIVAQPGPGNLLGNLLCAVTGLLDSPDGLARLLNQILAILG